MPTYTFVSPDGSTIDKHLNMQQPPEAYREQVIEGRVYKRVYEVPQMAINTAPGTSSGDFHRKTAGKNMTIGAMQDLSKEMSHERAAKDGVDIVREKHYQTYEKNVGAKHKDVVKREKLAKADASLKRFGVKVDLTAKP